MGTRWLGPRFLACRGLGTERVAQLTLKMLIICMFHHGGLWLARLEEGGWGPEEAYEEEDYWDEGGKWRSILDGRHCASTWKGVWPCLMLDCFVYNVRGNERVIEGRTRRVST